ncbi:c26bc7d0-b45c-490c-ad46-7ec4edd5d107 [Thermothielavioides terrestris]|uniref:C26bc7d0-b45c-490c-ad46-7ec4edd5d107 n=1 Tax=Thermothielavioides terrestris TaxID=2587410 RepID=A0A3S4C631_9PEZI|nr:c26bc7d0-b45c-490c-ad46-7ec4edd5d107 [Thermothielavioides terrestris]
MARAKEAAADARSRVADEVAAAAASAHTALSGPADKLASLSSSTSSSVNARATARLPGPVRFALAVVLNFALTALGRSFGLALGWFGDYDGYDLAALSLLSHGPATLLLSVFYGVRALTAGAYLAVDVVSAFLPFVLLRRLSGAHSAAPGIPNREIVVDRGIQVLTSLHSALVYSVVLFLANRFLLPSTLVLYFEGIPTIKPAEDAGFLGFGSPTTQLLSLLFGQAARTFIFTPLVTTPRTSEDQANAEFDPVNATLAQTVAWNLWGYTTRTKVSLTRTAVAMLFTAVGTYLDTALAIKGVEPYGAAVYASVWVIAALVTGLSLRYVGSI